MITDEEVCRDYLLELGLELGALLLQQELWCHSMRLSSTSCTEHDDTLEPFLNGGSYFSPGKLFVITFASSNSWTLHGLQFFFGFGYS